MLNIVSCLPALLISFLAVYFLLAYLYIQLFNIVVYGSCICICHMNIFGNWLIILLMLIH